jgi:hypothetical protein
MLTSGVDNDIVYHEPLRKRGKVVVMKAFDGKEEDPFK